MRKILAINFTRRNINLPLLIFLILFLNVKLVVKIIALLFIIMYSRNFKFGLSWKKSRLPLFYAVIIVLELVKYVFLTGNYTLNYSLVFGMGILQWAMSLLSIHYIKLAVEQDNTGKTHNTIKTFFFLNFLVSVFFLLILVIHPAWLMYWGHGTDLTFNHPSAGDAILGITFDASTVNATINCFGLIYFLYKKEYRFCFLNIFIIVICTSNVTFLLTLAILMLMILTVRSKQLRIKTLICTVVLVIFYFPLSPHNREYIRNYFVQLYVVNKEQPMEIDTETYRLRLGDSTIIIKNAVRIRSKNPDSIYAFSNKKLESAINNLVSFKDIKQNETTGYLTIPSEIYETKPGKLISFMQTYFYLKHNMKHLLFGSGIGNFSSKLAFRASGVNALGSYPKKYKYISPDFQNNHLETYIFYHNADASKHSVVNYPFTVYNQILGEYGLIGGILFVVFYVGYFIKHYRWLSYGRYMLIILLGFFIMEYWFELFSLVVIFELFMMLNIKECRQPPNVKTETPS